MSISPDEMCSVEISPSIYRLPFPLFLLINILYILFTCSRIVIVFQEAMVHFIEFIIYIQDLFPNVIVHCILI